jgi:catechol 2,3-dioxygenase-like lactoylglutathione lyase family enzyme
MEHQNILAADSFIGFYPCRDLQRTARFYKALGLEVARDQGTCLIFRVAQGGYLGFCQHEAALPEHPGLILTFVLDDVDGVYERLRSHGIPTEAPPRENARFGIYHFFARDPDGYRLEVQRFLEPL